MSFLSLSDRLSWALWQCRTSCIGNWVACLRRARTGCGGLPLRASFRPACSMPYLCSPSRPCCRRLRGWSTASRSMVRCASTKWRPCDASTTAGRSRLSLLSSSSPAPLLLATALWHHRPPPTPTSEPSEGDDDEGAIDDDSEGVADAVMTSYMDAVNNAEGDNNTLDDTFGIEPSAEIGADDIAVVKAPAYCPVCDPAETDGEKGALSEGTRRGWRGHVAMLAHAAHAPYLPEFFYWDVAVLVYRMAFTLAVSSSRIRACASTCSASFCGRRSSPIGTCAPGVTESTRGWRRCPSSCSSLWPRFRCARRASCRLGTTTTSRRAGRRA
eukprot:Opistho-1_new@19913